ncbi:MAG: hypothetical protein ACI9GW_002192 [Halieaceae bacterium]|jgi:hypothetical protein
MIFSRLYVWQWRAYERNHRRYNNGEVLTVELFVENSGWFGSVETVPMRCIVMVR